MGNALSRFREFISAPGHTRTISALVILIIAAAVPLTVLVAQQQQKTAQHAATLFTVTCGTPPQSYQISCTTRACCNGFIPACDSSCPSTPTPIATPVKTPTPTTAPTNPPGTCATGTTYCLRNYVPGYSCCDNQTQTCYNGNCIGGAPTPAPTLPAAPGPCTNEQGYSNSCSGYTCICDSQLGKCVHTSSCTSVSPTPAPTPVTCNYPPNIRCGTTCTNVFTDIYNCGSCQHSCYGTTTPYCNNGSCSAVKPTATPTPTPATICDTTLGNTRCGTNGSLCCNSTQRCSDPGNPNSVCQSVSVTPAPGGCYTNLNCANNACKICNSKYISGQGYTLGSCICTGTSTPTATPIQTASTAPTNSPTNNPSTSPTATPGNPTCTSATAGAQCTTCTAQSNYCGPSGTQTCTCTDSSGIATVNNVNCSNAAANCNTGYNCPNGQNDQQCVASASPTPTSSGTPAPTATPAPGDTVLAFSVGIDAIGVTGDNVNPDSSSSNQNPLTTNRNVEVWVFNSNNNQVADKLGSINYNAGLFTGTVNLGGGFATGNYTVKIKSDGHLTRRIPGIQNITAGITNPAFIKVNLVAGDIDGNNYLNINDYNILLSCVTDADIVNIDNHTLCNSNSTNIKLSDLEDNGVVNKFDYNLFLREYSVQNGD